jgi:hypothetical protein
MDLPIGISYKMPKNPRFEGNKKPADPGGRAGVYREVRERGEPEGSVMGGYGTQQGAFDVKLHIITATE